MFSFVISILFLNLCYFLIKTNNIIIDFFNYTLDTPINYVSTQSIHDPYYTVSKGFTYPFIGDQNSAWMFLNIIRRDGIDLDLSMNYTFSIDVIVDDDGLDLIDVYTLDICFYDVEEKMAYYRLHYYHQNFNMERGEETYLFNKYKCSNYKNIDWSRINRLEFKLRYDHNGENYVDGEVRKIYFKNFMMVKPIVGVVGKSAYANVIMSHLEYNDIPSLYSENFDPYYFKDTKYLFLSSVYYYENNDMINEIMKYINDGGKLFYFLYKDYSYYIPQEIMDLFQFYRVVMPKRIVFEKMNLVGKMGKLLDETYFPWKYHVDHLKILDDNSTSEIVGYFSNLYNESNDYKYPSHIFNEDYGIVYNFEGTTSYKTYTFYTHTLLLLDLFDETIWKYAYKKQLHRVRSFGEYELNSFEEFLSAFIDSNSEKNQLRNEYDRIIENVNDNNFRDASFGAINLYKKMEIIHAKSQIPPKKKYTRGLWMHASYITENDWKERYERLHRLGFTDSYFNSGSQYFNYTPSFIKDGYGNQLELWLKYSKMYSIRAHFWITPFDASAYPEDIKATLHLQLSQYGSVKEKDMCPSSESNVEISLNAARYLLDTYADIEGLHIDVIRFLYDTCYCTICRNRFVNETGLNVTQWPDDVISGGEYYEEYLEYRASVITDYVNRLSDIIDTNYPHIYYSAAVFIPSTAMDVGQDYSSWNIDELTNMNYVNNYGKFMREVKNMKNMKNISESVTINQGVCAYRNEIPLILRQIQGANSKDFGIVIFALTEPNFEIDTLNVLEHYFTNTGDESSNDDEDDFLLILVIVGSISLIAIIILIIVIVLFIVVKKPKDKIIGNKDIEMNQHEIEKKFFMKE